MSSPGEGEEEKSGQRLEVVIQKLEDTVLNPEASKEDKTLTVRREGERGTLTPVPARIRQIITESLTEEGLQASEVITSATSMQEENRLLQQELSRLEDLLAHTRAERDELTIKHHAVSERLQSSLRSEALHGESEAAVAELRRKFEEDEKAYKRKLAAYQEGQQRQSQLVLKLQNKVLQYKKRCGELEQQLLEKTSESEHQKLALLSRLDSTETRLRRSENEHDSELENALIHLQEEQQRSVSLTQVNTLLKEQLDQMKASNQKLSEELEKTTSNVHRMRAELEQQESQWRKDRESYNSYLSNEHSSILTLWRQAASLRSNFVELRTTTERGLTEAKMDVARIARRLQTACLNLDSNLRLSQSSTASSLEKQALQGARLEQQLRDKVREMLQLQSRWDAEKVELNSRITELTVQAEKLRAQNEKKEKTISSLKLEKQKLEATKSDDLQEVEVLKDEYEVLQRVLTSITQIAQADAESVEAPSLESSRSAVKEDAIRQSSISPLGRRASPSRACSPQRHDAALKAVQAALQNWQQQNQELRSQLDLSQDALSLIKKQLLDTQQDAQTAEQRLQNLRQKHEDLLVALEDLKREAYCSKSSLENLEREKETLETTVQTLIQQTDSTQLDMDRLKAVNSALHRQRDLLEEQKEDLSKERERNRKELEQGSVGNLPASPSFVFPYQ